MVVLILRLVSETLTELSLFTYKDRLSRSLRSNIVYKAKLAAGVVMISILGKQSVDYMTGKRNI